MKKELTNIALIALMLLVISATLPFTLLRPQLEFWGILPTPHVVQERVDEFATQMASIYEAGEAPIEGVELGELEGMPTCTRYEERVSTLVVKVNANIYASAQVYVDADGEVIPVVTGSLQGDLAWNLCMDGRPGVSETHKAKSPDNLIQFLLMLPGQGEEVQLA